MSRRAAGAPCGKVCLMAKRPAKQQEKNKIELKEAGSEPPVLNEHNCEVSIESQNDVPKIVVNEQTTTVPQETVNAPSSNPESTPSSPAVLPDLGEQFEVLQFIGEGGMGFVYKVKDKSIDKIFAVKLLKRGLMKDKSKSSRFEQEVQHATSLDHPNLVTVYNHALTPDGTPFMVMDFVDGPSLAEILAEQVFVQSERAISLFLQICDGVANAHVNAVVHLDLKPSNILIAKTDNVEIAKVSDFGIAQVMTSENQQITQTEEIIGSLPYMSPEHCRGETLDYRSDVYSLGCLMYEALTGKPPLVGENPVKTIMKHIQEKPKRLRSRLIRLDISEGLETVIMHCLEKNPEHRYQFVEEIIKDLELVRDGQEALIAKQQEFSKKKETDAKGWQKFAAIGASVFVLAIYSMHLSQFDTFTQTGYFIGSSFSFVFIFCLIFACFPIRRLRKEVTLRLKDLAQVRPGDRWLELGLNMSILMMIFVAIVQTLGLLHWNLVPIITSLFDVAPSLDHPIESTILIVGGSFTILCFALWLSRRRNASLGRVDRTGW